MLTTAEAAKALGVSTARIRQMIAEGKLTARKVGRDWQISEASVKTFRADPPTT